MNQETPKECAENSFDFLKLQYQILSDKQLSHNSLLWNTPTLLFVVQTFLWNISINDDIHCAIQCCASLFSVLIGFASLQTFMRNQLMEIADSEQLHAIEKYVAESGHGPVLLVHHQLNKRTTICNGKYYKLMTILQNSDFYRTHKLSRSRTYFVWENVIRITILLAILLFTYNLCTALDLIRSATPTHYFT